MGLLQKPKKEKRGIKILVYGKTGVGKSLFALSFPRNAVIDTEDGTAHYTDHPNMTFRLVTTSAMEIEQAIDEIFSEYIDEVDSIIIDSETKMYENLQHAGLEVVEKRAKLNGRDAFAEGLSQREWGKIKLIHKRINAKLIELAAEGKNIIVVAQIKDEKEKRGDQFVKVGEIPDAIKGLEYDFDIVLKLTLEDGERIGIVEKDRTNTYKTGDRISNPSYENWKHVFEGSMQIKEKSKINLQGNISKDKIGFREPNDDLEEIISQIIDVAKKKVEENKKTKEEISEIFKQEIGTVNPNKIEDIEVAKALLEKVQTL